MSSNMDLEASDGHVFANMTSSVEHEHENISSSEEQNRKKDKAKQRNWAGSVPSVETIRASMPQPVEPSRIVLRDPLHMPAVSTFSELLKTFPHLAPSSSFHCTKSNSKKIASSHMHRNVFDDSCSSTSSTCSTSSLDDSISTGPTMNDTRVKNIASNREWLARKEAVLTKPVFFLKGSVGKQLSQEEYLADLKHRRLVIPIIDTVLMQELIQEAGTFGHPRLMNSQETRLFPPCKRGSKCIGCLDFYRWRTDNEKRKFVFAQFMFEEELQALIERNEKPQPNECVVCIIQTLTEFVTTERTMTMNCDENELRRENVEWLDSEEESSSSCSSESANAPDVSAPHLYGRAACVDRVFQLFRNPKDVELGFYGAYCLSDPDACDVFVDPIITLNQSMCFLSVDKRFSRVFLDITPLCWRSESMPDIAVGERLSVFCAGVEPF
jgi:hypothetical protein